MISDWQNLMTRPNSKVSVSVLVSAILTLFLFDMALIPNTPPPNCIIIPAKQSVVRNWLGFLSMPEKRCRSVFLKQHYLQFEFYDVDENLKSAACLITGSVDASSSFLPPSFLTQPLPLTQSHAFSLGSTSRRLCGCERWAKVKWHARWWRHL